MLLVLLVYLQGTCYPFGLRWSCPTYKQLVAICPMGCTSGADRWGLHTMQTTPEGSMGFWTVHHMETPPALHHVPVQAPLTPMYNMSHDPGFTLRSQCCAAIYRKWKKEEGGGACQLQMLLQSEWWGEWLVDRNPGLQLNSMKAACRLWATS